MTPSKLEPENATGVTPGTAVVHSCYCTCRVDNMNMSEMGLEITNMELRLLRSTD